MVDKVTKTVQKLTPKQYKIVIETMKKIRVLDLDWLDVKPMKGFKNKYRVRLWKIRILFFVDNWEVEITEVWFRWDVYK